MMPALLEIFREKKRLLTTVAVVLLLNVVLLIASAGYQAPAIAKAQSRLDELSRRAAAAGHRDAAAVYRRGKADLETLRAMIPAARQFPMVLGDILEAAASSGAVLGSVTYKPQSNPGEKLLVYSIVMGVSGRYAAVKSFLADLEKKRELVVVDGVSLTNADPYSESVAMELHLTVYLRESV